MIFNLHPMEDSIFAKIIKGEISAHRVYEDDDILAFLDAHPVNPGHTLVVPKKACRGLFDCDPAMLAKVIQAVQKVAQAVKEATHADGINIQQNEGAAAGQKVFHLHFHVIPRFENDGFQHWAGKSNPSEEVAKTIAETIKQRLS